MNRLTDLVRDWINASDGSVGVNGEPDAVFGESDTPPSSGGPKGNTVSIRPVASAILAMLGCFPQIGTQRLLNPTANPAQASPGKGMTRSTRFVLASMW